MLFWILERILSGLLYLLGNGLYYIAGKTCSDMEGSHYIGKGQYTRRECVLAPFHSSACVTEWEWNESLHRHVRFWFAKDNTGTYARAELN